MSDNENDDIVSGADKAEKAVDFSALCEGVSYSEGMVHIEQYGSKLSIVTNGEFTKMTNDIFCAVKERVGMNYEQSIMKINEHNGREHVIKKQLLNSIPGILSQYSPGTIAGAEGTGLDKYLTYELMMDGVIGSLVFAGQLTTNSINTQWLGVVTVVQAASTVWPVRCPT